MPFGNSVAIYSGPNGVGSTENKHTDMRAVKTVGLERPTSFARLSQTRTSNRDRARGWLLIEKSIEILLE